MQWRSHLYRILDLIDIPDKLTEMKGKLILHVSDTPSSFYQALDRLIKTLDPPWVIHTGDLVDQVKLEIRPNLTDLYALKLRRLRSILEYGKHNENRHSVLVMGNHDHEGIVRSMFRRARIIPQADKLKIHGLTFNVSHYYYLLKGSTDSYNLYGHDTFYPSENEKIPGINLNGILSINFIHIETGEVYSIPYPRYVDDHRLLRHKTGL